MYSSCKPPVFVPPPPPGGEGRRGEVGMPKIKDEFKRIIKEEKSANYPFLNIINSNFGSKLKHI